MSLFETDVVDGTVKVKHLITGRTGKVVGKIVHPIPPVVDGATIGTQSNLYRVDFGLSVPIWAQDYNLEKVVDTPMVTPVVATPTT